MVLSMFLYSNAIICSVTSKKLCKKCIDIDINMLSVFANMYANISPGVPYGIMYSTSYIVFIFPITCISPNINPDVNINVFLSFIMFFIDCLNTISSTNGAYITDDIKMYSGAFVNVLCIACSFPAIPCVSALINVFDIIIIISVSI